MIERTLPIRTVSEANRRGHWGKHARRTADQRRAVAMFLRSELGKPTGRLVSVRMTRIAPRSLDAHDNLRSSMKACVDGVADYFGINDRGLVVEYAQEKSSVPGYYGVRIALCVDRLSL